MTMHYTALHSTAQHYTAQHGPCHGLLPTGNESRSVAFAMTTDKPSSRLSP